MSQKQHGFTLIELMIVVAIAGILAIVAMPSYNEYVRKTHRTKGKQSLMEAAQWMERAGTAQGTYPAALPQGLQTSEGGRYTINAAVSVATGSYTLTATPSAGQIGDRCGNLLITQSGARTVTVATTPRPAECWAN